MGDYGLFGFDFDEFDWVIWEGSEGLCDVFEWIGRFFSLFGVGMGWLVIFEDLFWCLCLVLEIVGEVGDGVWVIYMVDVDGGVCVE